MSSLPTNWRAVTASDSEFDTCAKLLSKAHPENKSVSSTKLAKLLQKTYYEPLEAAGSNRQPLLLLYGYSAPGAATTIVVAFHKTIKRSDPSVPTGPGPSDSKPTRRWWCISVGCDPKPTGGVSYPLIRDICKWFHGRMKRYELLVLVDDNSRINDPTRCDPSKWEVDAAAASIAGDSANVATFHPVTLSSTTVQEIENSYDPFKRTLTVMSTAQLVFTGIEPNS
jgi:hypothetical protein